MMMDRIYEDSVDLAALHQIVDYLTNGFRVLGF